MNRGNFTIKAHEGRWQPYTVWRGREVWHFCFDLEAAETYITQVLARERLW